MPDIFDISTTQASADLLPEVERTTEKKSFLKSLLSAFSSMWGYFISYKRGADIQLGAPVWAAGTYSQYDAVYYMPTGQVFECNVASTTAEPTTSTDWRKVLDCFIGVDESQNFGCGYIGLTYALNRRFGGNFVPDPSVGSSDIFIATIPHGDDMFQVGYIEDESSAIYLDTCTEQLTYDDTVTYNASLQIWVPYTIFDALAATDAKREMVVREFADKYISAGIIYYVDKY